MQKRKTGGWPLTRFDKYGNPYSKRVGRKQVLERGKGKQVSNIWTDFGTLGSDMRRRALKLTAAHGQAPVKVMWCWTRSGVRYHLPEGAGHQMPLIIEGWRDVRGHRGITTADMRAFSAT